RSNRLSCRSKFLILARMEHKPPSSPSSAGQLDREEAIFNAARTLPPEDRDVYLQAACANNAALRERIQMLLTCHDRAGDFLTPSPPGQQRAATIVIEAPPSEKPVHQLGH